MFENSAFNLNVATFWDMWHSFILIRAWELHLTLASGFINSIIYKIFSINSLNKIVYWLLNPFQNATKKNILFSIYVILKQSILHSFINNFTDIFIIKTVIVYLTWFLNCCRLELNVRWKFVGLDKYYFICIYICNTYRSCIFLSRSSAKWNQWSM